MILVTLILVNLILVNSMPAAAVGPMWRERTTVPTVDNLDALGPLFPRANSLSHCNARLFFSDARLAALEECQGGVEASGG